MRRAVACSRWLASRSRVARAGARRADDHDERLERRPGAASPTSPTSTATTRRRRRASRSSAAARRPGSPTPRAGSSTPAWSARDLGAGDPRGPGAHAVRAERRLPGHQPRQPGARTSPARRSRTSSPGASRTGAGARVAAHRRRSCPSRSTRAPARAQVFESVFVDLAHAGRATARARSPTAAQVRDFVEQTPGRLGLRRPRARRRAARAPLRGRACTRTTIRSGAYPARRPLGVRHPRPPARRARALPALGATSREGAAGDRHALHPGLRFTRFG